MCENDLKKILENHLHWLREDCEGWKNMRANLYGADLSGANLSGANLYGVNLSGANLYGANLSGANLSGANLYGANLYGANLSGADLYGDNLSRANLSRANLSRANLSGANLYGADLSRANLSGANLYGADLSGANLSWADLYGAVNLFVPITCPDTGSFIAYKKARNGLIVKLQIPEDARRSSATGRKCRCDKAVVLEIQKSDGSKSDVTSAQSKYDPKFFYTVGKTVSEQNFCDDRFLECAPGIHFFITREEAVRYV